MKKYSSTEQSSSLTDGLAQAKKYVFLRRIPFWNLAQGNSTRNKKICKQARPHRPSCEYLADSAGKSTRCLQETKFHSARMSTSIRMPPCVDTCCKWVGRPNGACIVTWTTTPAAATTAFTSLPEAHHETPGHYRLPNCANVAFRGMLRTIPLKSTTASHRDTFDTPHSVGLRLRIDPHSQVYSCRASSL